MDKETKLNIVKALHAETGCGLMTITQCLDSLIYSLNHQPAPIMDVGYRLDMKWEEYDLRTARKTQND